MGYEDEETTTYARPPRYEPPSLALMMRFLELLTQRGTVRLTIQLDAEEKRDASS